MAVTFFENGVARCAVDNLERIPGYQHFSMVGRERIPGRREPDEVTFTLPSGVFPDMEDLGVRHTLVGPDGVMNIHIKNVSGGLDGSVVRAYVSPN